MSTRVFFRNRMVYRGRDAPEPNWGKGMPWKDGRLVGAGAIPPDSPQSPFREGVQLFDSEDQISYRVVRSLDATSGWAVSEFWQLRWRLDHRAIIAFVETGLLDAAIEMQSHVRRFRCRDERLLKLHPVFRKHTRRMVVKRNNDKRVRRSSG